MVEIKKNQCCCSALWYELLDESRLLRYYQIFCEYGIKILKSTRIMIMDYCIFCGEKLPDSLRTKWFDVLEHEYNLEDPEGEDKKRVPKEFLTDEWWKKRGL